MSKDIIIERATLNDAESILMVQKEAFKSEGELYKNKELPALIESLDDVDKCFKATTIFIAKNSLDNIIGAIRGRVENNTCHISRLIVHPEFQMQGIGSRLLMVLEFHFSEIPCFELFTGSRSLRNIYFYESHGYSEYRHKVINENLTIIYMRKNRRR